jgi:hypothetical protein
VVLLHVAVLGGEERERMMQKAVEYYCVACLLFEKVIANDRMIRAIRFHFALGHLILAFSHCFNNSDCGSWSTVKLKNDTNGKTGAWRLILKHAGNHGFCNCCLLNQRKQLGTADGTNTAERTVGTSSAVANM